MRNKARNTTEVSWLELEISGLQCHRDQMLHRTLNKSEKGWFAGPWDSSTPIAVGFANTGINEPHVHGQMHEIYLVARGQSTAIVNGLVVPLSVGDCLIVEPGEAHTFTDSSEDDLHFVVQAPFVRGDKRLLEHV